LIAPEIRYHAPVAQLDGAGSASTLSGGAYRRPAGTRRWPRRKGGKAAARTRAKKPVAAKPEAGPTAAAAGSDLAIAMLR